jgi:GT2 family glycosyltransferase
VEDSTTELDYITTEKWPFLIQHLFIHQAGACNARNLALAQTESEWVFLADDDIRVSEEFIEKALKNIKKAGVMAMSVSCLQNEEVQKGKFILQWGSFGSGCSFVFKNALEDCEFKRGYEFGYGEDSDFGMQLRNLGHDILYFPEPEILHLKAPIGGFRTKPVLRWHSDVIQPKPSPTVLFYILTHNTKEQLCCYKTNLFIKYYSRQAIKNPFRYYVLFQKQWEQSRYWANVLKKES